MTMGGLFSGIGGIELAAERAGMDVRWSCEIEPYCQKVLKKHWPHVPVYGDIREVKWDAVEPVEFLGGGPPCQPSSIAGKQLGEADDRWLWPEVHRAVAEIKPRWCCFENPPGLLGVGLHKATGPLESLGYEVRVVSLPACAVGAPHERQRLWIIAYADSAERRPPTQGRDVANGNDAGREEAPGRSCVCHQDAVDADAHGGHGLGRRGAFSGVCRVDARISTGLDGPWTAWTGDIPDPLAKGVPNRIARLTALGNSVVPAVAQMVLAAIMEADRER